MMNHHHSSGLGGDVAGKRKPTFQVPVVAATILYAAFQHVEHWPAPLVKAYADDCFGPRSWVDDERCRLFVQNLALAHAAAGGGADQPQQPRETKNSKSLEQQLKDAKQVAQAYQNFAVLADPDEDHSPKPERIPSPAHQLSLLQRRHSLSSAGSGSVSLNHRRLSLSADSVTSVEMNKTINQAPPVIIAPIVIETSMRNRSRIDSESFGEQDHTLKPSTSGDGTTNDDNDGNSSSSGEEDEEVEEVVEAATAAANSKTNGVSPSSGLGSGKKRSRNSSSLEVNGMKTQESQKKKAHVAGMYPISLCKLDLTSVRQRFFGANLEQAHGFIISSLQERLDLRSKQNSGLLSTLPSFLPVPAVRMLVAEHLERWLQSPALAGLARSLFSSTVGNIEQVDPPLMIDLKVVDCILSMRLKANQVRSRRVLLERQKLFIRCSASSLPLF